MGDDALVGLRQGAVAAALGRQIDNHRARLHPRDGFGRDQAAATACRESRRS